jgi:hypothetical protein
LLWVNAALMAASGVSVDSHARSGRSTQAARPYRHLSERRWQVGRCASGRRPHQRDDACCDSKRSRKMG